MGENKSEKKMSKIKELERFIDDVISELSSLQKNGDIKRIIIPEQFYPGDNDDWDCIEEIQMSIRSPEKIGPHIIPAIKIIMGRYYIIAVYSYFYSDSTIYS